jgi:hypothetical protein
VVYALQAELAFSTAARRDAVLADINSQIASRPRWGESTATAAAVSAGANGIVLELRFTSRADADAVRARIESFASGQRLPLAGSVLRAHDCSHDAANPSPCVGVTTRAW